MLSLRTLCLPLLGVALLALPGLTSVATAQTTPKPKVARKPATRLVPNTSPAARAADPLRGTNDDGKGNNTYAAPGEPVNMSSNGKKTPSYDGPAPKPAGRPGTTLAPPK